MQMELDVLSAVHFIAGAQRLITSTTVKNFYVKCGFSNDHISSNDDSAVKLSEDEEDDWYCLHPHGVQFEDCTTCDSALEVCGIFLDAQKGLGEAREYIHQFDMENSIIMYSVQ
jgi:hypothetical protein